jgi:hypothetical protein
MPKSPKQASATPTNPIAAALSNFLEDFRRVLGFGPSAGAALRSADRFVWICGHKIEEIR